MLRVRVCVSHIGGSLGPKFFKQENLQIGQRLRLQGDCLGPGNEVGNILVGQVKYRPVLRENVPTRTTFLCLLNSIFLNINVKNHHICYMLL